MRAVRMGRLLIDSLSHLRSLSFPRHQVSLPSPLTSIMSTVRSTSTSHSNFETIFNAALETYRRKTKKDLASDPLFTSLQSCDSPEAILTVFREQIPAFDRSQQDGDDGLIKWVTPAVTVLHAFSASSLGKRVEIVIEMFPLKNSCFNIFFQAFPPATAIFAGIGVLLLVSVIRVSLMQPILTPMDPRPLKMPKPAKTSLLTFLAASNVSSIGLRYILASNRLRQCRI
jgi:hypothetical protein